MLHPPDLASARLRARGIRPKVQGAFFRIGYEEPLEPSVERCWNSLAHRVVAAVGLPKVNVSASAKMRNVGRPGGTDFSRTKNLGMWAKGISRVAGESQKKDPPASNEHLD